MLTNSNSIINAPNTVQEGGLIKRESLRYELLFELEPWSLPKKLKIHHTRKQTYNHSSRTQCDKSHFGSVFRQSGGSTQSWQSWQEAGPQAGLLQASSQTPLIWALPARPSQSTPLKCEVSAMSPRLRIKANQKGQQGTWLSYSFFKNRKRSYKMDLLYHKVGSTERNKEFKSHNIKDNANCGPIIWNNNTNTFLMLYSILSLKSPPPTWFITSFLQKLLIVLIVRPY